MVITYHGYLFIKIQLGDTVVAFNPVSKSSTLKAARFGADVGLISMNDPRCNGAENLEYGDKKPFIIDGPGEYEIGDMHVYGVLTGGSGKLNTAYMLLFDDVRICHLGALSLPQLSTEIIESLGEIDVLFVPIMGEGLLGSREGYDLATSLEPKVIVPLYESGVPGKEDLLALFLKEEGDPDIKPQERLTLKKKDLADKEAEIIVLSHEFA